eukprot:gene23910-9480_t
MAEFGSQAHHQATVQRMGAHGLRSAKLSEVALSHVGQQSGVTTDKRRTSRPWPAVSIFDGAKS